MTNEETEILYKAVQIAFKNGWDWRKSLYSQKNFHLEHKNITNESGFTIFHLDGLLYNHDFAKSLVGTDMQNGQPRWKNFLQFIVVQDDPIKALEMFL